MTNSSSPPHSKIFLAEADRLEAGGFNLVIDIKTGVATTPLSARPIPVMAG